VPEISRLDHVEQVGNQLVYSNDHGQKKLVHPIR
jgi:hypothetical protein